MIEVIKFHPDAIEDYLRSLAWYRDRSLLVAEHFQIEFAHIVQRITDYPEVPAADRNGVGWYRMKRFAHVVHYVVLSPKEVQIVGVSHGNRRPSYWKKRLS